MNSVQLNQRVIFLVIGYPGAGKSYFSRQFAELTDSIHLSEDRLRYELFGEPTYEKSEDEVVGRIRDYLLEELVKSEKSIIIDADIDKAGRKLLKEQLRATKSPVITIWVQTDLETSFGRASSRDRRQTDDKYTSSMTFETFDRIQRAFKRPEREEAIVISGKHLFKTQAASVTRRLMRVSLVKTATSPSATVNTAPMQTAQVKMTGRVDPNVRRMHAR
jgi:predicted kinase